jgi:hypothetical protein
LELNDQSPERIARRWLDWQPHDRIMEDSPEPEPTKPSKPGFVGFDGSAFGVLPKIAPPLAPETGSSAGPLELDCVFATERPMSWAAWKAEELNRLFRDHGVTGQPGHITPETVLHGERTHQVVEPRQLGKGTT